MSLPTNTKADLVPFRPEYFSTVRSWIDSKTTYRFVCRGMDFPPPEDAVESWQREGVTSYLLIAEGQPVAYGELWKKANELALEIAHLLVSPSLRTNGYGYKMLTLLCNQAAARVEVAKLIGNLYDENKVALGCLLKAGFELVGKTNYAEGLRLIKFIK